MMKQKNEVNGENDGQDFEVGDEITVKNKQIHTGLK